MELLCRVQANKDRQTDRQTMKILYRYRLYPWVHTLIMYVVRGYRGVSRQVSR